MSDVDKMDDETLIDLYDDYSFVINCGSYGIKDLMMRDMLYAELKKRGYELAIDYHWEKVIEEE